MRINRMTLGVLSAILFLGTVDLSQAGTGYDVKCTDDKCGFKTTVGIGGGFNFEQASGYCVICQKGVSVSWKRGEKAPDPIVEFWDPMRGTLRQIYKCPKCGQPFVVIRNIEDLKFCPKCKKPTIESKAKIMYD